MPRLFTYCLVSALLCLSFSAVASQSLDPKGAIFIKRTNGDILHCGPIAAIMARHFADTNFTPKNSTMNEIKDARGLVNDFIGIGRTSNFRRWWHFKDIETYLTFTGVNFESVQLKQAQNTEDDIKGWLDKQQMVLVNVNMNHIPRGETVNKPYFTFYIPGGWGHYLAIVGYQYKDDKLYFEAHDSFSDSGRNRLYEAAYIVRSMKSFEPKYLRIEQGV